MTEPGAAVEPTARSRAMTFVVLMGAVSLFADACYEGARAITGPYLAWLGASATAVGAIAGAGELVGYVLRYVTGRLADRTRAYWAFTFVGYGTNLIAVPLMGVVGSWQGVAALIVLERLGKAIRNPARSTLLAGAAGAIGHGRAFAVHEALDQLGGIVGPLLAAGALWLRGEGEGGYAWAFGVLGVPAVATMVMLAIARRREPVAPAPSGAKPASPPASPNLFRLYLVGVALVGVGLADWAVMAFHLARRDVFEPAHLPLVYAGAMAVDGVAALIVGAAFDRARARGRAGLAVLAAAVALGAATLPLVLLGGAPLALVGIAAWAAALGATESIGKATVSTLADPARRGAAFGTYYAVFGLAWWAGSLAVGIVSERSLVAAAALSAGALLAGAAVLLAADRAIAAARPASSASTPAG